MTRRCARLLSLLLLALSPLAIPHARTQQSKDPLTAAEEEQVREASDEPNDRLKLYLKFIDQRTDTIQATVQHPQTRHPGADVHNAFEQFTRLADELADNLDAYDQSHTDVRKGLRVVLDRSEGWPAVLNQPPPSPEYDFARKTALEAAASVADQARTLLKQQEAYFAKQKAEKHKK